MKGQEALVLPVLEGKGWRNGLPDQRRFFCERFSTAANPID
jgi:hypothetical protein